MKPTKINDFVGLIKDTADFLGVEPKNLQYNQFVPYLRDWALLKDMSFNEAQSEVRLRGGFVNIRDAYFKPKFHAEAASVKKLAVEARKAVKEEHYVDTFIKGFSELLSKDKSPSKPKKKLVKDKNPVKRHLHLLISDTHLGAYGDPEEGLIKYGPLEQSRRMAQIALQTAEYKPQHRKNTKLFINLTGDILQGILHDPRDGLELSKQAATAIWLLVGMITFLSDYYEDIEVNCVSGNHDRNTSRHKDRATQQKWDSIGTIVYYGMKMSLQHLENVKVNIFKTPWISYKSFGVNYYGTHGDTHINPGNPGSSINVSSLENQINKLNASLKDSDEYKVVFLGHVHTASLVKLGNGVTLITNGALTPIDAYAKSIGIHESQTGQWLWESIPGYPVGDIRFITVNQETDKDESLDLIIEPFKDF